MSSEEIWRRSIMAEKVKITLVLSGTYWNKAPEYKVMLGDEVIEQNFVTAAPDEEFVVEFERELPEASHTLSVSLLNKEESDTVQNSDKTDIVKDMVLNIVRLEIGDIDVEELKWSNSIFKAHDNRDTLEGCVNLGWNGDWLFTFDVPYYVWLIENM